jgi:hypothetical protein
VSWTHFPESFLDLDKCCNKTRCLYYLSRWIGAAKMSRGEVNISLQSCKVYNIEGGKGVYRYTSLSKNTQIQSWASLGKGATVSECLWIWRQWDSPQVRWSLHGLHLQSLNQDIFLKWIVNFNPQAYLATYFIGSLFINTNSNIFTSQNTLVTVLSICCRDCLAVPLGWR